MQRRQPAADASLDSESTRPRVHRALRQASSSVPGNAGFLTGNAGFVTGPPSRAHWKPDAAAIACELCGTRFSLITRRHHCRTCGGIFCGPCSKHVVRLDQNAEPHPAGVESRICQECHEEFSRRAERSRTEQAQTQQLRLQQHQGRKNGSSSRAGEAGVASLSGGKFGRSELQEEEGEDDDDDDDDEEEEEETDEFIESGVSAGGARAKSFRSNRRASVDEPPVAQSVPTDWSWSTF